MVSHISEEESLERVALLRRFKRLLEEKRGKFREYLSALEAQEKSIAAGNTERIERQSLLGEAIVSEIYTIQKVIDPIEAMYRDIYAPEAASSSSDEMLIPKLQADLEKLHCDIETQNKKNRDLLKSAMGRVRNELAQLKKPYARKSVFASESDSASLVDIRM